MRVCTVKWTRSVENRANWPFRVVHRDNYLTEITLRQMGLRSVRLSNDGPAGRRRGMDVRKHDARARQRLSVCGTK